MVCPNQRAPRASSGTCDESGFEKHGRSPVRQLQSGTPNPALAAKLSAARTPLLQDYSLISVGTKEGYNIYNCEPFCKSVCFRTPILPHLNSRPKNVAHTRLPRSCDATQGARAGSAWSKSSFARRSSPSLVSIFSFVGAVRGRFRIFRQSRC